MVGNMAAAIVIYVLLAVRTLERISLTLKKHLGCWQMNVCGKGKSCAMLFFDAMWKGKKHEKRERDALYRWLAEEMAIPVEDCHFGYFNIEQLRQAYRILKRRSEQDGII